jgi:hypothetical protein
MRLGIKSCVEDSPSPNHRRKALIGGNSGRGLLKACFTWPVACTPLCIHRQRLGRDFVKKHSSVNMGRKRDFFCMENEQKSPPADSKREKPSRRPGRPPGPNGRQVGYGSPLLHSGLCARNNPAEPATDRKLYWSRTSLVKNFTGRKSYRLHGCQL